LILFLGLSGCAGWLRYEPVLWAIPTPLPRSVVEPALERDLARGRIPSLEAGGARVANPADLDDATAWTAWWTAGRRDRGVELDFRLGDLAIEVARGLDGSTRIDWAVHPRTPTYATVEELSASYGVLAADGDARWRPEELGEISKALGLLAPDELALVDDVQLWRMHTSPRHPKDELAWYDPTVDPVRVEVYDQAFVDEDSGFVGTPDAPYGPAVSTLLHELGHALAASPIRRAYADYVEAVRADVDPSDAWWQYREADRADAVLRGWKAVWFPPGPSTYGKRSLPESFAEAFMLHHADPAALKRVAPAAEDWMARGRPAALATRSRSETAP
jgi:hypothetical protein